MVSLKLTNFKLVSREPPSHTLPFKFFRHVVDHVTETVTCICLELVTRGEVLRKAELTLFAKYCFVTVRYFRLEADGEGVHFSGRVQKSYPEAFSSLKHHIETESVGV